MDVAELHSAMMQGFAGLRTEFAERTEELIARSDRTDRRMDSLEEFVRGLGPLMERILERIEVINEVCDHNENVVANHRNRSDSLDVRVTHLEARVTRLETRRK